MLERQVIQNRGVKNVWDQDRITGFEFLLRMPNYRGAWGRLIDGVEVNIGDLSWPREAPLWTLQGRQFSVAELRDSGMTVRWNLDELAKIYVPHEGGLAPGVHELSVAIAVHAPYIPAAFQPSLFPATRKVTVL